MLNRWIELLGTRRKSRRHRAFIVKQADVELLERRALLSTVKLVSNIAGSATVSATITVTSLERTPLRQAQIMFDQSLALGAQSQLNLCKDPGIQVIQIYIAQTKGLSRSRISARRTSIVKLMLKKIQSFKPMSQVSHHIVAGNDLQVVDIAPSSFSSSLASARFISAAIEAQKSKLISHIIKPGAGEKAIHLEIPL